MAVLLGCMLDRHDYKFGHVKYVVDSQQTMLTVITYLNILE